MKTLYRRSVKSTSVTRLFTVLVLASLLFSVLPALSPSGAIAQDGDTTTTTAEVQQSEDPTQTTDGQETGQADTAQEVQDGGVASYIAEARTCPPGFDPAAGDASAALAACIDPLAGVAVTLGTQNAAYPGDTRTTGGDGVAVWSDIPLGTGYSAAESVPQGYGDPWVYCEITGGPGADQYFYFPATGGYMDVGLSDPNLANYAQTYCRWFNIPPGDSALAPTPDANLAAGTGDIHLSNYLCPVNYNTADMTLGALKAACTTPGEGFTFTVKASKGGPQTATTNAQGGLIWFEVPAGKITIDEAIPDGYWFAQPYCSVALIGNAPGAPDLSLVQSDGKTISGQIANGQALHCELFNIPEPESTVAFFPFLCPSDYAIGDMTLGALTAGCSIPGNDIEFTLTDATGEQHTGTTGSNGFVEWQHLPSGTVAIEESVPPGYWLGPTYCDPAPPQGELDGTSWQMPKVEDGVVSYDIPDRSSLNCSVFYIWSKPPALPTDAEAHVVNLTSYICPPGSTFDTLDRVANNSSQCHGAPGWAYEYAGEGFTQEVSTDPVGATAVGHSPAGPFTLTENAQEGSRPVALWCSSNGGDLTNMLDAGEYVFAYTPTAGEVLNCQWFNVALYPEGTSVTITIEKHLCGPDFPDTSAVEDWQQACPDPHPGVTFDVEQAGGSIATGTTGDDGLVTIQVQPGDVNIVEAPPDEFPGGYAWCGTQVGGGTPTYVNAGLLSPGDPNMPLTNVTPDYTYYCQWFNAPLGSPETKVDDGGNVVVIKWRCPEDFDAAGASLDELLQACSTPQEGVTIGVYYASGAPFTELTRLEKGPAIARFEGLPPGNVGIGEPGPSGHELQRVICRSGDVPQAGLTMTAEYTEYTVADSGIATTIEAGKEIECQFFNVPAGDEDAPPSSGSVFVDKRSCPPGFAAIDPSYVDITTYCTAEPGVEFKLTRGETTLSAVTGGDGIATFPDVAAGALRIAELPREGYDQPRVFCLATAEGEGATGELTPVTVDNWGIAYDLQDGDYLECVWANMPAAATTSDPGTVMLHAYTCPEGTGEDASLEALLDSCTVRPEGLKFTVGQPLATPAEAVTAPGGDVTFSNVASGSNLIDVPAGQGFKPIAAWCDYYSSAAGSGSDFAWHPAQPLSTFISGGYTLECSWFDVPYVEPVTVTLLERLCPADYGIVGASREDILFNCTASAPAVDFRLRDGTNIDLQAEPGAEAYDVTRTTDTSGSAVFEDVPAMPLGISELSPRYEAVRVYCGQAEAGSLPTTYSELGITNEEVRYDVEPGANVFCYWIDVEVPPFDVGINVSTCLPYSEFEAADLEYLTINCTPTEGIDFQIANEDAAYEKTVTSSVAGLSVFEDVPPGTLVMTEGSPDRRVVRVFCGTATSAYSSVEFSADTAEYIGAGENVICYWFTIDTRYSRITLFKYACPESYLPAGQTHDAVLQACPAPQEGVRFDFDATGDNYDITDDEGVAGLRDVSPGPWTITETPPPGYSDAIVFCRENAPGQPKLDFALVPVENFTIDSQVEGGNELECHWFNINVAHATVTIHKYACYEGDVAQGHTYEDILEECPAPLEGVTFTLGSPAAEISQDTDASGNVSWEEIEPGPLFISETPLPDFSGAIVYCAIRPESGPEADFEQVPVEQLAIEREVAAGEGLECYWFNYPAPEQPSPTHTQTPAPKTGNQGGQSGTPTPDAPASLIITKHTCAAGYDLHGPGADPARDCDDPAAGIEFTLAALDARAGTTPTEAVSATDHDGVVAFTDLDPGLWLLTETLPEHTLATFISTCASDRRDFQAENPFTPFAYAGPEGQIGVALIPGETLECDSYDVSPGVVTILNFQCAGVQVDTTACERATEPITIGFTPVDGGEPFTLTTDESGAASAEMPTGVYAVTDQPDPVCLIDSEAFDAEGQLVVAQGEPIEVRVYTCGGSQGGL